MSTYTITDGHFNQQGQLGTATGTVSLTVNAVDDLPMARTDYAWVSQTAAIDVAVLPNDFDGLGEGDVTLTWVQASTLHQVAINPDQTIHYDGHTCYPPYYFFPGQVGWGGVGYRITDSTGNTANGTLTIYTASDGSNDPSFAQHDYVTMAEDGGPVVISPMTNDWDPDGAIVLASAGEYPGYGHGTVSADLNQGTITYTPTANYNGQAVLMYTIRQGNNPTAQAYVNLTITPVNDNPVANPDTAEAWRGDEIVVSPKANDTDVDGDGLILATVDRPEHCDVWFDENQIHFTALDTFVGETAVLNYTVADGHGGTASSTVAVQVKIVDLTIYDGQSGDAVAESQEESRGAFTIANLNDTDGDDMTDYVDDVVTATPRGRDEVDLMRLDMSVRPASALTGEVSLYVSGTIALWQEATKGTRVPMNGGIARFDPSVFVDGKKTIWVELTAPSATLRDNDLLMVFSGGSDIVKATGVWAAVTAMEHDTKDAAVLFAEPQWSDIENPPRSGIENWGGTGLRPVDPVLGVRNVMAMQFTVQPPGIRNEADVHFDITRRFAARVTTLDTNGNVVTSSTVTFPNELEEANDDSVADDEIDEPNQNNHMYVEDEPGIATGSIGLNEVTAIYRASFEEFMRVGIKTDPAGDGVSGSQASNTFEWHCCHLITYVGGAWVRSTGNTEVPDVNDIGPGRTVPGGNP